MLVAVEYVSKWVEVIKLPMHKSKNVLKFLQKNIFARFRCPQAIINDGGFHVCNNLFANLMVKYRVTHNVVNSYHPQSCGQVEVSNEELK